jgi:hypothetical protein
MKASWRIQEIVDLGIYSKSTIEKAIYKNKTLKVVYANGVHSPRVLHTDLIDWLGYDPLAQPNISVEITKTVKTKDRTTTTKTRIEREAQLPLFDLPNTPTKA